MPHKQRIKYINVPLVDVEAVLPFNKKPLKGLKGGVSEEERVKAEITDFIRKIQKNMHEPICYIGEEKQYGKHLERFMFSSEGFVEIMVDAPLTINAHFTHVKKAKRYANALKKTLRDLLPDSKIKEMFIDSITVDESGSEPLTYERWDKMHHIFLHKSIVFTMATVAIIVIFEGTKALLTEISVEYTHISSIVITVTAAIIIALLFEPIIKKCEEFINRFMIK